MHCPVATRWSALLSLRVTRSGQPCADFLRGHFRGAPPKSALADLGPWSADLGNPRSVAPEPSPRRRRSR